MNFTISCFKVNRELVNIILYINWFIMQSYTLFNRIYLMQTHNIHTHRNHSRNHSNAEIWMPILLKFIPKSFKHGFFLNYLFGCQKNVIP